MLDPPEQFGRDWCLLALQLGLTEDVPAINQAGDRGSPTDKLLLVWEKGVSGTVVSIIDALRGIGRDDAAQVLIEGLTLFRNSNSSVVVNVPGVALTSYAGLLELSLDSITTYHPQLVSPPFAFSLL